MSIDKSLLFVYSALFVLVGLVMLYFVSKHYYTKLLASLDECEISVLNFGNQNEPIHVVDLGIQFGTRVLLSRTHQTISYWLPFFAFVTVWDPAEVGVSLLSQVLKNKTNGKKLVLIEDTKGNLKFYTPKEPA